MNLQQLSEGNNIAEEIKICKENIKAAQYMQSDAVVNRETYLKVNGLDDEIIVPANLFKVVGKLILSEYEQRLYKLETELKSL